MGADLHSIVQAWLIRARSGLAFMAAAAVLISCSGAPKKEHALLSTLRQMGSDLPVRRTELIAKCHFKNSPSTRHYMGMRAGWGGTFESWPLPDGGKVNARFNSYSGGFKLNKTRIDLLLKQDAKYPSSGGISEVPATTWFNEVSLVDHNGHTLYFNEKRPTVKFRGGEKLPDSHPLL